ncbi:exodeoxyribonuclease VII large subunit [Aerococcaceae bacterium DSM 111020]|nr:exodeoxyribonuclease VII large subunit [Aerococcaceae bacterium DSM 111020]
MATRDHDKYLTVKALSQYIRAKFDRDPYLQQVFVVGEISNYRKRPNTHQYFNLKDDNVQINAVMFKSAFNKVPFELEEGMKVYVRGRVQTYPARGTYQIIIDHLEPDGLGAFYLAFEQLKKKLQQAGWFDRPKREIPTFPKKIAVVTSPTGAVIRDIITTVQRRYPIVELVVYPTRVQGEEAVGEIQTAFEAIQARHDEYDTVIVARGGGSIEDLWCFNDEKVAEAIHNCSVPVISSIGHETDTTIADLVADLRAPTPTAAAEMAVPVLVDVLTTVNQWQERLIYAMTQRIGQSRKQLERYSQSYVLKQPDRLYQPFLQSLDQWQERLHRSQRQFLQNTRYTYQQVDQRLAGQTPKPRIEFHQHQLATQQERLHQRFGQRLLDWKKQRQSFEQLLEAHSPISIVQRGYAITEQADQIVHSVEAINANQPLTVRFIDGHVETTITEIITDHKEMQDE